jgi:hypothetical protein
MFRRPGNVLRALACVVSLLSAAGCGDACRSLVEQICVCQPDDGTRAACNQRAHDAESSFPLRPEDVAYCQHQLDTHACDCNRLTTVEGRQGCGVAYTITGM